ncbi:MAG TPA: phosphotransferase [Ktedonobacteraceae bacterium]|nr:phosphotransferase [Ktedonobacteraceae bacterium]
MDEYDAQVEEGGQEGLEDLLDLNEVMHAFGVEEWYNLGPTEPSQSEVLSLLVEIQGQRYVLKERAEGLANEDTSHRYEFRTFLQQVGIPIPSLRLTPTGEHSVSLGEDCFELEEWVDGEQFSTASPHSLSWVSAAGTMLGRIHQASRRYAGKEHRWPSEAHIGGVVQGYLNLAYGKAEASELSEIQALSVALTNWCDQWAAVLPAAMVSIGATRGLPEFHIHGDYHALNLRFAAKNVTDVLNWQASRWEKRIIELAAALFYFSALEWYNDSPLTRPLVKRGLDPERARLFLSAYGAIYPPVPGEAAVLGDALTIVAPIATINGPLEDLFFAEVGREASTIDDVMERLSWASSLPAWLVRVRRSLGEMWA